MGSMAATNTMTTGIIHAMLIALIDSSCFVSLMFRAPLISASLPPAALGCPMALARTKSLFYPAPNCNAGSGTGFGSGLLSHWFGSGPRRTQAGVARGLCLPLPLPTQPVSVLHGSLQPHLSFPTIPIPIMYSLPPYIINQIIRSDPFTR